MPILHPDQAVFVCADPQGSFVISQKRHNHFTRHALGLAVAGRLSSTDAKQPASGRGNPNVTVRVLGDCPDVLIGKLIGEPCGLAIVETTHAATATDPQPTLPVLE